MKYEKDTSLFRSVKKVHEKINFITSCEKNRQKQLT